MKNPRFDSECGRSMPVYVVLQKRRNAVLVYVEIDDNADDTFLGEEDIRVVAENIDWAKIVDEPYDGLATMKQKINIDDAHKLLDMIASFKAR